MHLLQLSLLARLLSPEDFGLIAMTTVVMGLATSFQDLGISSAIIHYQEITKQQLSTLYWINVITGFGLFLLLSLTAPLVAAYYQEGELTGVITLSAAVLFIQSFGQQYAVLFHKKLEFRKVEWIDIASRGVNLLVAVSFAVGGAGVYAIIYGNLGAAMLSTIFLVILGRSLHMPERIFQWREIRPFFQFGSYQLGERLINYFSANFDKILIGKLLGMNSLGFYNMAWQLISFPLKKINPIVNKVALPVYARLQQDRPALSRYYSFSLRSLSLITTPLMIFLLVFAPQVILVLYGEGWETTAKLMQILAMVGLLKGLANPGGAVILALGRADIGFWWNVVWTLAVVTALWLGAEIHPDIYGITGAFLLINILGTTAWHLLVRKVSGVEYRQVLLTFLKILIFTLIGLVIIRWGIIQFFPGLNVLFMLILAGLSFGSLYGPYVWWTEKKMILQARKLLLEK